jgi:hypothetical protein
MESVVGRVLEDARKHFLTTHEEFYKFASVNRPYLQYWLDTAPEDPIDYSVRYSMALNMVDSKEIEDLVKASMRFRVLAGILNRPVEYDSEDIISGGFCKHQEYDKELGGWKCKVDGNQAQADAWHEKFGHGCACPFWESPHQLNPMEQTDTELERMVFEEGKDIDDALMQLGLRHGK